MKKRTFLLWIFLISILIALNFGFITAYSTENAIQDKALSYSFVDKIGGDIDDDGIDDNFEELNKRDIEVDIVANEITIQSVRRSNKKKDQIVANIVYDEDGISFEIQYKSQPELDFELIFGISFRKLIEFIDVDFDGIFNPDIDINIQNFSLSEISPAFYDNWSISSDSSLHYLKIQTENKTFTTHIYFAEEFSIVENSLILPTQARIKIEISDFDYLNESSQLALYTRVDSEAEYHWQEDTEDETNGYASNEEGLTTTMDKLIGFLTWKEDALIDNVSKNILISELMPDYHAENAQKFYINYPRGNHTYHYSKVGIEGLLITESVSIIPLVVFTIIISALSAITVYAVYTYNHKKKPSKNSKRYREEEYLKLLEEDEIEVLFDSKLALQILGEEGAIEKLYFKGDLDITAVSADFYNIVNQFGFEENEKTQFIKEMLSLPPFERELILREMLIKSQ